MSNTFLTSTDVSRDAGLILQDNLLVGLMGNRSVETKFNGKVGSTVYVKVPPIATASELAVGGTTNVDDITESRVPVVVEKHIYIKKEVTSEELTYSLDDFNALVQYPVIDALVLKAETYFLEKLCGGFAQNLAGTAGNQPSTLAHIVAAEKKIFDNKANENQLVSIISSTAHASLLQATVFTSSDYGPNRPSALVSNSLGKMAGMDFFRSPYSGTYTRGDITGSVTASGTAAAATCSLASLSSSTGTIYAGTRFVVAGDATIYTVMENATIASNAVAALSIYPVLATSPSTAAVTFETAFKHNVVFNPVAFALAMVTPPAVGAGVSVASSKGISIRVSSNFDQSYLKNIWTWDFYIGARVVQPKYGCILCG